MITVFRRNKRLSFALLLLLLGVCWAQYTPAATQEPKSEQGLPQAPKPQQNIPDAPSTVHPPPPKVPAGNVPDASAPQNPPPSSSSSSQTKQEQASPNQNTTPGENEPSPPAPQSSAPPTGSQVEEGTRNQLFTLIKQVNFVIVPVTIKDRTGMLVEGLLKNDFSIYEDGIEQPVKLFTSDPFPISAAVVVDLAMSQGTVKKINESFSALEGAFSQFDEVAVYTYAANVTKVSGFTPVNSALSATLRRMKSETGRRGGVPVVGGPMQSGPSINSKPVDPSAPHVQTPVRESSVLNDAILTAALDLGKRDRSRRKIIFVISDGREDGSTASYSDVMKVLLSNEIAVYAVAVGDSALPLYGKLQTIRVPGFAYGNLLPKYASATGGEVFTELKREHIEEAYSQLTRQARNQYTIGYTTRVTPSSAYRSIEVRVNRGGLKVYAKDGYYPLPVKP